ncbi:MAG: glycosyltransferase family 2 protein [Planctomycetota bacterium]|jgi:dolichol-phosphate mannosyltransferase|nr:glycosyltransferase family 2 protein [Planctomycetota bacterium]MEC7716200.1 glycosyltransferase family 2 protein [Planctomycetota bacterium]MEC8344738.1 glycosyltransferase family 2 protein [Planctomycetota bacterium]MED5578301.1 glycosyltransferase family 2 protein [Planctomycetota bacterium]MEE3074074.1 glycosyltransferase family 2 protein [Planctomycetota bacterium]
MLCSAVIPVFNEEASLARLHEELRQVCRDHDLQLEIWFVDDGSRDGSWSVIEQLAETDPMTYGLRFRRNFGKAAALSAGFASVRGDVVFTLDADLQDDPKEIPRFLEMLKEGYEVISGWKIVRNDPWHKTFPSRIFNGLVGKFTGVKLHDHNCGFKCYRREVLDEVDLYGELHRFIPVLASSRGFRVGELAVDHRAREFGASKYGFERFIKGFLDLLTVYFLTGFRQRPQHLLGTVGLLAFGLGGIGMTYLAGYWILKEFSTFGEDWLPLHQRPLTLYSLGALLLGFQLISLGFLAELITAYQGRSTSNFSIKQRIVPSEDKRPSEPTSALATGVDGAVGESKSETRWTDVGTETPDLEDPSGLRREDNA